jgi:hypothetical protein
MELREPREEEWPAILALANLSVEAVAGAGSQEEWLHNRRRPSPLRRHFVAVETGTLVGYAAIESRFDQVTRGFRLFLVAPPSRLAEIGSVLYRQIESLLGELGAAEAWFIEYASDQPFLAFLAGRRFQEVRRFRLESGVECSVLSKHLREA